MDVARSESQGAHHHADVIYMLPQFGIKKGQRSLWYSELSLHQLGSQPTCVIPRWLMNSEYKFNYPYEKCLQFVRFTPCKSEIINQTHGALMNYHALALTTIIIFHLPV